MVRTTFDVLSELEQSGILKDCISSGIISYNLFNSYNIYKSILEGERSGKSMTEIAIEISINQNIHERTVYKIKKRMVS